MSSKSSGYVGTEFPVLVTELNGLYGIDGRTENYLYLLDRVLNKHSDHLFVNYNNVNVKLYRFGPYTMARVTFEEPDNKKHKHYTGFGLATKNFSDDDHPEAGQNLAFTRAAKELFRKYVTINKL